MPAKNWEDDFRYEAINASLEKLSESDRADVLNHSGSYCVPAAGTLNRGLTPGKIYLVAMLVGFCGLVGGAYLVGALDRFGLQAPDRVPTLVAVCCSLGGMLALFAPLWLTKSIVWSLLGNRARDALHACSGASTIAVEVSSPHREELTVSIDADDYGLVFADEQNKRLVIEALNARYQIRASDLISLEPFQFINYLGAIIECEIADGTTLHIAIARMSLMLEFSRQVPIFRYQRNPTFEQCCRALDWKPV